MASNAEILAERAWQRLRTRSTTLARPYWVPANLVTGRPYMGLNGAILGRVVPVGGLSLFCTLKQANSLGAHVRTGETAAARVVFYKDEGEGRAQKRVPVWTPVFHIGQIHGIPAVCLQSYDLKTRLVLLPTWMTKLDALYKRREELPHDHAIALPKSAVSPLVLLAARAFLTSQTPREKVDALLTPDLRALLWPVGGLDAADAVLDRIWARDPLITPALPLEMARDRFDAEHPRSAYAAPVPYYLAVFYALAWAGLASHVQDETMLSAASALGMLALSDAAHLPLDDEATPDVAQRVTQKQLQDALGGCTMRVAIE